MELRQLKKDNARRVVSFNIEENQSSERVKAVKSLHGLMRRRQMSESNGIEDLVICEICMKRLHNPKMLTCQHTFCYTCLEKQLIENVRLKCKICNKVTLLDDEKRLDALPSNIYIDNLLMLLEKDSVSLQLIAVSDDGDGIATPKCSNCKTDYNNLIQHKCAHCKLDFCNICWTEHTKSLQMQFNEFTTKLNKAHELIKQEENNHNAHIAYLKDMVEEDIQQKLEKLKIEKQKLFKEIDASDSKNVQILNEAKSKTTKLEMQIGSVEMATNIDEIYMSYHKEISKLLEEISKFSMKLKTTDMEKYRLLSESSKLLTLNEILLSKESLKSHYQSRQYQSKFIWTDSPKCIGLGIAPWSSNELYIVNVDSRSVLIMDRQQFKIIRSLKHPNMLYPYSITFGEMKGEIFVSDKWKHCVHVFNSNGDYIRSLLSRGREQGQVVSPKGLAITPNGKLIVCDSGNDRVIVLDPIDGKHLGFIGLIESGTDLNMPSDVDVFEDKIIIADTGNNRIKVYNNRYEKVLEIGSMGKDRGQFHYAEVVGVDKLGFIFVGDAGNMRVQIFDPNGSLVKVIGNSGMFNWVSGIIVTPDLDIITTDYKKKSIMIF